MPFTNLTKQSVPPEATRELVLNQLAGDPILVVRVLGESNKPFWNDALAKSGTSSIGKKKRLTDSEVKAARAENRGTVAKYAVVGLKNVFDDQGKPATNDDIDDVIDALPDDVFDKVLLFVTDPDNFRDRVVVANPEDVAGKS